MPEGTHVAYSKICTHAGCPVGLYRAESQSLICPCHQSQFDVSDGAKPFFGPAARPLPQLPLGVDEEGILVAQGDFSEPVGPAFWDHDRGNDAARWWSGRFKYLDERLGTASLARKALRKVFPDHWSFLLGEIALFALVVLVFTGTFLTFFYTPSVEEVVYHGPYAPLQGDRGLGRLRLGACGCRSRSGPGC